MSKEVKNLHNSNGINETFSYGIIYVYSIPLPYWDGRLKIGSTTVGIPNPSQQDIEAAAKSIRIKNQTQTADVPFKLEHAVLAVTDTGDYFSDQDVHNVLLRSGFPRKANSTKNSRSEWFEIDLEIAKKAIQAVKEGRIALTTDERISPKISQFSFRPNQLDAIEKTTKAIKNNRKHFLWNAKMRFGKTSAAMQVAKVNEMQKVLIVTHRPSVSADWYEDFGKVFAGTDYQYSSKLSGEHVTVLVKGDKPFVYFASLQDLRLSKRVVEDGSSGSKAGGFDKNDEVFDTVWDMVIIDEAHEGTQSDLGDAAIKKIPTHFTLELSGTPFNLLRNREEEDIYTWDYVMEQDEKLHWDERNSGVPNPYAELPALNIFTYDIDKFSGHLGKLDNDFRDKLDGAFKFHEFFRVHKNNDGVDTAEFVHEPMVRKFLDLLVDDTLHTKFPYATEEYRNHNRHSLWLLPNRVKVIEAMEKLLKEHTVFGAGNFGIVNISGNSYDDEEDKDAKERVTKAIQAYDYTITLTGQRLTTGASVKEWTAVFMMSDTSSATTYLQTAFRCQTPARIDGKLKTQGYVFDFAPDRTLKLIAEAIELNHKSGKINSSEQKEAMEKFLNFCPILAAEGGMMKPYNVDAMLEQLKKAIIERVSRNGFDDPKLYNDELLKLDEVDLARFNDLKGIVGSSTSKKVNEIEVNNLGMDDLKVKQAEEAERKLKQKQELTGEEKEALKKRKEAREQKNAAIDILRAVSIRMPMLVYGANVSVHEDITLDKFVDLVDEESWREFMPAGLTKEKFGGFTKYYDEDVFKGVARSIRAKVYDCDDLLPTERIQAIAEIFGTFKNPDKETVLTPWSVVNKHLTVAFGGYDFCSESRDKTGKPEWNSLNVDTSVWTKDDTKILEINSKSGLYPLLSAYNVYSRHLIKNKKPEEKISRQLWNQVLADNIYVLCKSPMAKSITLRTLAGYSGSKTNITYIKDLVKKLQQKDSFKDNNLKGELLEKFGLHDKDMKFTAVVGNPPYQETIDGRGDQPPIYQLFLEEAYKLSDLVTMIHPARFLFNAGLTPKDWNKKMLHDTHLKVLYFEQNSAKVFPNTDIKGGVAITFRDNSQDFGEIGVFTSFKELSTILEKVESKKGPTLDRAITGRGVYRLTETALRDHPEIEDIQSKGHKTDVGTGAFDSLKDILFHAQKPKDKRNYIKILGLFGARRVYCWVDRLYINNPPNFEKYKVILPNANGSGALGEVLSTPLIGEPLIGYTETFIGIGAFDKESDAVAALKYIKSKFCRTMLGVLKVTQHNSRDKWTKVPLQDFTNKSDIDWSKSIADIDKQFYAKYGFDEKEISFIETHVKSME